MENNELAKVLQDSQNSIIALSKALGEYKKENELLKNDNTNLIHKNKTWDRVTNSSDAISMGKVSKILDIDGMSQNKLFKKLRNLDILMYENIPYSQYMSRGYFKVIEQEYTKPNGEVCIGFKTLVYQKGIDYIRKIVEKDLGI